MVMTYNSLAAAKTAAGSIKSWINYDLVDPDTVLLEAQAWIFADGQMRVREMRGAEALSLPAGQVSVALPTGFLDPIALVHADNGEPLTPRDEVWMALNRAYDGTGAGTLEEGRPLNYAIWNERFQFDTKADAAYAPILVYYALPTFVQSGNQTNFLCTRYPHILRAACQMKAAEFRQDDAEYARHKAAAEQSIVTANAQDDLSRRGISFS
jgi:hypothetical protein